MLIFVICYLPPLLLLRYVNINHLVMVLRILYCMAVWMGAIMGVGTPLVSPLQARFHQHYKSRGYGTDHLLYGRSFVRVGFESYHPTLRFPIHHNHIASPISKWLQIRTTGTSPTTQAGPSIELFNIAPPRRRFLARIRNMIFPCFPSRSNPNFTYRPPSPRTA
jgi:hypothetical protein